MKAIAIKRFVENYSDLQVSKVPPPPPNPRDEILVDITHAGLNHVDLLYARGKAPKHPQRSRSSAVHSRARVRRHCRLVANLVPVPRGRPCLGRRCKSFRPVDRCQGECAAASTGRLESGRRSRLGAATASVSYGTLVHVAKVQRRDRAGARCCWGRLGVVAVQIARAMGARVIGTVGSMEKAGVVRKLGVDLVIRYNEPEWEKKVLKATGGKGVDVVFDTVGLVEKSLRCLRYGGRIVVAGFAGLEGNMEKLAMNRILLKGTVVLGYARSANHQLES
jgi:NADPH:quinone reductase-like Zn-dependent oxidoreductase